MSRKLWASASTALVLLVGACGSSDNGSAADTLDSVVNVADTSTGSGDAGPAREAADAMMAMLVAMPDGGAPTLANFQAVGASAPAGVELTGLDDGDNDGTDDDAKATVEANGGEDKACLQQQDGAWEVTDDEC